MPAAELIRIPVRGFAHSTLLCCFEMYAEDAQDEDEDCRNLAAVAAAFQRGRFKALAFAPSDVRAIRFGVLDLLNGEDSVVEVEAKKPKHKRDPDTIRHARAARDGLSGIYDRLLTTAPETP
jgi:hypothetical protein